MDNLYENLSSHFNVFKVILDEDIYDEEDEEDNYDNKFNLKKQLSKFVSTDKHYLLNSLYSDRINISREETVELIKICNKLDYINLSDIITYYYIIYGVEDIIKIDYCKSGINEKIYLSTDLNSKLKNILKNNRYRLACWIVNYCISINYIITYTKIFSLAINNVELRTILFSQPNLVFDIKTIVNDYVNNSPTFEGFLFLYENFRYEKFNYEEFFIYFCKDGNYEAIQFLINFCNINIHCFFDTGFYLALANSHFDIARFLYRERRYNSNWYTIFLNVRSPNEFEKMLAYFNDWLAGNNNFDYVRRSEQIIFRNQILDVIHGNRIFVASKKNSDYLWINDEILDFFSFTNNWEELNIYYKKINYITGELLGQDEENVDAYDEEDHVEWPEDYTTKQYFYLNRFHSLYNFTKLQAYCFKNCNFDALVFLSNIGETINITKDNLYNSILSFDINFFNRVTKTFRFTRGEVVDVPILINCFDYYDYDELNVNQNVNKIQFITHILQNVSLSNEFIESLLYSMYVIDDQLFFKYLYGYSDKINYKNYLNNSLLSKYKETFQFLISKLQKNQIKDLIENYFFPVTSNINILFWIIDTFGYFLDLNKLFLNSAKCKMVSYSRYIFSKIKQNNLDDDLCNNFLNDVCLVGDISTAKWICDINPNILNTDITIFLLKCIQYNNFDIFYYIISSFYELQMYLLEGSINFEQIIITALKHNRIEIISFLIKLNVLEYNTLLNIYFEYIKLIRVVIDDISVIKIYLLFEPLLNYQEQLFIVLHYLNTNILFKSETINNSKNFFIRKYNKLQIVVSSEVNSQII